MEIQPGIIARHTALWLPERSILSFADLHLGYDEELYNKGVHVPTNEFAYVRNLIGKLVAELNPQTIIFNGDLKHTFGTIHEREWREVLQLLDMLAERKVIIIRGNHDIALKPIARKRNMDAEPYYVIGDILFIHGDALPDEELLKGINIVIIGHEHPAIGLTNGVRTEHYKCFLKLPWNKRTLIVQPSTFSLTHGTDVLAEKFLSPFLTNVSKAEVFVVGENGDVLNFGRLNRI
jgi:uncharacterized protein